MLIFSSESCGNVVKKTKRSVLEARKTAATPACPLDESLAQATTLPSTVGLLHVNFRRLEVLTPLSSQPEITTMDT